jgi:hypothetical protein
LEVSLDAMIMPKYTQLFTRTSALSIVAFLGGGEFVEIALLGAREAEILAYLSAKNRRSLLLSILGRKV